MIRCVRTYKVYIVCQLQTKSVYKILRSLTSCSTTLFFHHVAPLSRSGESVSTILEREQLPWRTTNFLSFTTFPPDQDRVHRFPLYHYDWLHCFFLQLKHAG